MGRFEARSLDRLNSRLVQWRVGRLQPAVDRPALRDYLRDLPEDPLEQARETPLRPRLVRSDGHRELWSDRDSDWIATRFVPRGPRRAALVFLHGWLATPMHVWLLRQAAQPLLRAGVEVWVPRLPAHMERTPKGTVSGAACLSADLVATAEALRLAVGETCALARWLRTEGGERVGIWGISLGGWVGGLAATCSEDWDAAALWTPVVDPQDTLQFSPLTVSIRASLEQAGIEESFGAAIFSRLAPVGRTLRIAPERVLVLAARYDNVVSRESIASLETAWGVEAHWQPHGHISILWSRRAKSSCREFLAVRLLR